MFDIDCFWCGLLVCLVGDLLLDYDCRCCMRLLVVLLLAGLVLVCGWFCGFGFGVSGL